jgi:hypothetical protein
MSDKDMHNNKFRCKHSNGNLDLVYAGMSFDMINQYDIVETA